MDYQLWVDYHLLWCTFHRLLLPFSSLIQAIWHPQNHTGIHIPLPPLILTMCSSLQRKWPKTTDGIQSCCGLLDLCVFGMSEKTAQIWCHVGVLYKSLLCMFGCSEPHSEQRQTAIGTHTHGPLDTFSFNAWWTTSLPVSRLAVCSCLHNLIKTFLLVIPV